VTENERVAVIAAQPEMVKEWLATLDGKVELSFGSTPEDLSPALADASAIFCWGHPPLPFGRYLDLAPRVRWVHSSGAGIESLIVPQLLERSITLTNSRGAYSVAVAELALTLMLAWAKRLPERVLAQKEHRWAPSLTRAIGGATLVIVGLGSIGSALARLANGLDMQVIGVRRSGRPSRYAREVVAHAELQRVLPRAQYLAVSLPDTSETRGIIGARELALLPTEAFVVNVGRGSTIDEVALVEALRGGRIGGAGLDVFKEEPLPATSPLWDLAGVLVSPHFSNVVGFEQAGLRIFFDNLERFQMRRRLRNLVNARRGY
jgi:phosphoglycerate dehydrogenase-like enzyme